MRLSTLQFLSRSRLGHRGAILLILSTIDVTYGASLMDRSPTVTNTASAAWRAHYAPAWVWGTAWILVGLTLVFFAFRHADAGGFAVAIGWKIIWGFTTLASWAFGSVDRGWVATIIWATFAAMITVISGWPEPVRVITMKGVTLHVPETVAEPDSAAPPAPGTPPPPTEQDRP